MSKKFGDDDNIKSLLMKLTFMKTIHVIGINGSPRNQATQAVLEYGLDLAKQHSGVTTDQINLREFDFKFCLHCNTCRDPEYFTKTGHFCVHNDDLEKVFPQVLEADSLILATPVYSGNPSGMLLSFMNRLHAIGPYMGKKRRTMQFIVVGERRRRGMDTGR